MRYLTFFQFIIINFGFDIVKSMKQWINLQKSVTRNRLRIIFLNKCLRHNVIPPHLNRLATYNADLHHFRSRSRFKFIVHRFVTTMIRIEIFDAHRVINLARDSNFRLLRYISHSVPIDILNRFFNKQSKSLRSYYRNEEERMNNKFDWLLNKQKKLALSKMDRVHYFCVSRDSIQESTDSSSCSQPRPLDVNNTFEFSFNPPQRHPTPSSFEILIEPQSFHKSSSSALSIKDKWFVNLSSVHIPLEVQGLVQLGENFCLPSTDKDLIITNFLKNIEIRQQVPCQHTDID